MTEPTQLGAWDRRPLSIAVLGNSIPLMQMPPRSTHGEGTYPEVLADRLAQAGIPVQLKVECRWFELADSGARRCTDVYATTTPDVLIIHYGVNEMAPWLMPVPAIRHLMRRNQALGKVELRYRARIAEPLWTLSKKWRRYAAPKVGTATWQLTPFKFRRSIDLMIRNARATTKPLVLVMDVNPPGPIMTKYLPGVADRHPIMQQVLTDAVQAAGDKDVRLISASSVTEDIGLAAAMPDSIHWTPDAHARVAAMAADEVFQWLASGGHL